MKKTFLNLVFSCFTVISLLAQPTLSSNDIVPRIGDREFRQDLYDITNLGGSGSNQTWVFNGTLDSDSFEVKYTSPTESPFGNNFTQASYVRSIVFGNEREDRFYQVENNELVWLGLGFSFGGLTRSVRFNNPQTTIKFPLTINSSGTDTYEYSGPGILPGTTVSLQGFYEFKVDGFGQLTTPLGTYLDVFKVLVKDSSVSTETSITGTTTETEITEFALWYKAGIRVPLLEIEKFEGEEGFEYFGNVLKTFYPNSGVSARDHQALPTFSMYPNPANHTLYIQLPENDGSEGMIHILGLDARVVYSASLKGDQKQLSLKTSTFSEGLYIVRIETAQGTYQNRLLIAR